MLNSKKKKLGDLLLEVQMITPQDLEKALAIQNETGKKLEEVLLEQKLVSEQDIIQVLEFQLGIPHVELDRFDIEEDVIKLVNNAFVKKYSLLPIKKEENVLTVAMSDPLNVFAIDDIAILTGFEVKPVIAAPSDIAKAIDKYYTSNVASKAAQDVSREVDDFAKELHKDVDEKIAMEVNNSPAVILVNNIFEQAVKNRASDIHIEPFETYVKIRYRVDGELTEVMKADIKTLSALVTRIKIIGGMNIAEKRIPQDGRVPYTVGSKAFDLRVNVLPTVHGEKVCLRLTEKKASVIGKASLGMQEDDLKKFEGLLKNPHGIILVTGPTGSGKSTTLYTALRELNTPDVNIVTVEDPVENVIDGINQVNVNSKAGLTFASALRAILRQDPDIVMIGEIRDGETAEIAVKAAITGHLVLSTLHTNDAPSSINRLIDMGIEPFMLSSSVVGVIAQRLVRRVCKSCKEQYEASEEELNILGMPGQKVMLSRGKGCEECNHTGYKGRLGLYEMLIVNKEIREAISKRSSSDILRDICTKNGMKSLKDYGFQEVLRGSTTIEEILGVAYENEE